MWKLDLWAVLRVRKGIFATQKSTVLEICAEKIVVASIVIRY